MLKYMGAFLLFCVSLMSHGAEFIAGQDFEVIDSNQTRTPSASSISVTEFFSFGCPWCYRLEPVLEHWVKQQGATIQFKKIPVVFHPDWDFYAKAYYAAQALSMNATLNPALFKAILDDKKSLKSNQDMIDFFVKNGVERGMAESAFNNSPSIELDVKEGTALMGQYHINAVPAIVVNQQFRTDLQMAKTEARLLAILDFLIAKSQAKN